MKRSVNTREYLQSLLRVTCLPIVRLIICLCCFLIVFPQYLKEINTSETIPSFLFSVVRLPICLRFNHSADLFIHLSLQVSFSVHVHIQLFFKWFFISLQVGPSGSIFGIIACLFVELLQSWQIIARPFTALFKLCGLVLLLLIIGLLPYVDNFAHMIGFLFGLLLAFIFLPYVSFGQFDRRRKRIQIIVSLVLVITLFVVGFLVFYISQDSGCNGCEYLNCIPFTRDFCKLGGQNLQPRVR